MTDIYTPTTPAAPGSDELISLYDQAHEAYLIGVRADPDDLVSKDPWALALQAVDEHVADLRWAVIELAVESLRRPAPMAKAG